MREQETSSLPPGWANVTIEDLAAKKCYALAIGPFGSNLKVSDYRESGVPLVFVREIRSETFGGPKTKCVEIGKAEELAAHAVSGGDLLVTKMGDPPGDTSIYPRDLPPAVITADCIKLTVNEASTPEFLRYWLRAKSVKSIIQSRTQGVAQQKLSLERFRSIPLPLPPVAEQERILAKLEELFSELDAGVDALHRAKRRLARYRQSLLRAAVTGELTREWREKAVRGVEHAEVLLSKIVASRSGLTTGKGRKTLPNRVVGLNLPPLPEKWTWCCLPEIGELARGKSRHRPRDAKHLYGGPYAFIQTGDIRRSQGIINQHEQTYSDAGLAQSRLWPKGTLCITIAANIAETGVLQFEACFPDSVVGFIPYPSLGVGFFEAFIRSEKERLESYAPATAQKNINLETLSNLAVPLPPLDEQRAIIDELDRHFSAVDALEAVIRANLGRSERLRQSILERAFRGELVPQDPADETAEAVMARLRESSATKAGQGTFTKRSYIRKTKTAAGGA